MCFRNAELSVGTLGILIACSFKLDIKMLFSEASPNVSTTPITAMGCQQCLPFSVVQLKGKHCRKPHCRNGVVDTFRQCCPILLKLCIVKGNQKKNTNYYIK